MPFYLLSLVLLSALLHAVWNLAAKKVQGNLSVLWLGMVFSTIISLPFAIQGASLHGWHFILITSLFQTAYLLLLGKAYQLGEISFVYPIARGSGVAGAAVMGAYFLEESISFQGSLGIIAVILGIIILTFKFNKKFEVPQALILAMTIGLTIILCTYNDKLAVAEVEPIFYMFSMYFLSAVFLSPYVYVRHRVQCKKAFVELKRFAFIIGLGSFTSYLLFLYAFKQGQMSYLIATREIGVVFSAVLGVVLLKERVTARKVIGVASITLGLLLIKFS